MLSIIVAVAKNNVIGKDNKLIWHIPEDLKRFKKLTTGHNIIMGRKTFESLGRVLPNRKHIVLCNDAELNIDNENVEVLDNIEKDIYADGEFDFEIVCPYCDYEFFIDVDENRTEVTCPECQNVIELDWSGDTDEEENNHNCNGSCSGCHGCDEEDDDM